MRASQLAVPTAAKSAKDMRLIVVPVRVRCIAPVADEPFVHRSDKLVVRAFGLPLLDAQIDIPTYTADRQHVVAEFVASIPVYAAGMLEGVNRVRSITVEFEGWVSGIAKDVSVSVIGDVLLIQPGGNLISLTGADR